MELLAGAKDAIERRRLRRALADATLLSVEGLDDWEQGAALFRTCREAGGTPRSQLDCLIAAVAIREDVPVLHADRDFDLIAEHTSLRVAAID
jgi:predicted nucleic acid-binding protein